MQQPDTFTRAKKSTPQKKLKRSNKNQNIKILYYNFIYLLWSDTFVLFCMTLKKGKYFTAFLIVNSPKKGFSRVEQLKK